ncbi:MAG: methyltransferase family protein [Candidatus Acidiferrales bacterium]
MPNTSVESQTTSVAWKNAITVAVVVGGLTYFLWKQGGSLGPMTPLRAVGIALAAVGLIGWVVARLQLGKSFSIQAKATELVTHGIYSKIRNPVYVFGTVFIAGLILWIAQPLYLLVLVVLVPAQVVRARKEAQVLEAKFGDAYRAYCTSTWF